MARSEQVSVVRANSHATFDAAGAGNVIMAAGLRATAKAVDHPPEPKVGAPVLDPTAVFTTLGKWGIQFRTYLRASIQGA